MNDRVNEGFFFIVTCVVRYGQLSYLSAVTVKVRELERDVLVVGDVDTMFERHLVQSCGNVFEIYLLIFYESAPHNLPYLYPSDIDGLRLVKTD